MIASFESRLKKTKVKGLPKSAKPVAAIVPHAGWAYSGFTANCCYSALSKTVEKDVKPCFAVLCPNHSGAGASVALSMQDWETPLGVAKSDAELSKHVLKNSKLLQVSEEAHAFEHAVEVQVPFLQHYFKDFSIVPIALMRQDIDVANDLSMALAQAGRDLGRRIIVVASSDFTHYEPAQAAREKDMYAIEAVKSLDEREFLRRVVERQVSACGYGAIAMAIAYAKIMDAKKAELLHFSNSGEVTGDVAVVDYAGMLLY
jgi:hypothetical protein